MKPDKEGMYATNMKLLFVTLRTIYFNDYGLNNEDGSKYAT